MRYKLLILLLVFSSSRLLSQKTYYVSTSGNDSFDGLTELTPWLNLSYAESQATTPGDIIALKKGDVWLIDNVFEINSGGSSGKSPTLRRISLSSFSARSFPLPNSSSDTLAGFPWPCSTNTQIPRYSLMSMLGAISFILTE